MVSKGLFRLLLFLLSLSLLSASQFPEQTDLKPNGSVLTGYGSPQKSFAAEVGCGLQNGKETTIGSSPPKLFASSLKLHLRPRFKMKHKEMITQSTVRDRNRIRTLNSSRRLTESINQQQQQQKKKKNETPLPHRSRHLLLLDHQRKTNPSSISEIKSAADSSNLHIQVMATLKSGVSLGSGEYFMDVFIGTPPKKFQLIVDTGSDLTWIQCLPCHDCFNQTGPFYNPNDSTSFRPVPCHDPRCRLVTPPDTESSSSSSSSSRRPCKSTTTTNCRYFYWYGDSSNTTGDFALETFTLNLTNRSPQGNNNLYNRVEDVMFGCGHWNRGLIHGAAGLIGLGQGPLSFFTQLQSLYGRSFSYCLVGWNSGPETTSKLIFGDEEEDEYTVSNPKLMNFTAISVKKEVEAIDQTFYYVQIKSIVVGGEVVDIPEEKWRRDKKEGGGAIVDSGTTLSYFLDPMYRVIKEAFVKRVRGYSRVEDFLVLSPCYNVSGAAEELDQFPSFGIKFSDGTEWNFPVENYFVQVGVDVVCLAMLGTPSSSDFSIIGNYLQQNFHVSYDLKRSRLGFAPAKCGDV